MAMIKRLVRETQPTPPIMLQTKTVTENGTVTADDGFQGLRQVTVNVESADAYESVMTIENTINGGDESEESSITTACNDISQFLYGENN